VSLRDELQSIYDQHGQLTPELVVTTARPKGHPLHNRVFDRAPKQAAEAWYRHQAHELIQSVKVVYRDADEDGPARSVRVFHCVHGEQGHVYEPVERVVADPFSRQLVLRDMERDWKQLRSRYEQFAEFTEMVSADMAVAA
jgi:hypothetical protein